MKSEYGKELFLFLSGIKKNTICFIERRKKSVLLNKLFIGIEQHETIFG